MRPQVSQHFGACCQVTEGVVTEPGLQADSPSYTILTCGAILRAGQAGHIPGTCACARPKERSPPAVTSLGTASAGPHRLVFRAGVESVAEAGLRRRSPV